MNLLCPNCQKMLQVPEQYAGQLMKCPLCTGTFTVPALPQAPTAPPPPPPPGGYSHTRSYTLNPRVVPWIAPLSLLVVFVLLFFSWVGMYPSGIGVVTQSGWQVAFNGYDMNEVWKSNNKDAMEYLTKEGPGVSITAVFFLLVVLPGLMLALGTTLVHLKMIPVELPPSVMGFWSFRPLGIAALSLAGLVFVILTLVAGFPIEAKTHEAALAEAKKYNSDDTPEKRLKLEMDTGKEYGKFNLQRPFWLHLTLLFLLLAVIGALLDFWLERRRPLNLPVPRADYHY